MGNRILDNISTALQAVLIATLLSTAIVLSTVPPSRADAASCKQAFDDASARIRDAIVRNAKKEKVGEADNCRDISMQFYEVVEARQAIFACYDGYGNNREVVQLVTDATGDGDLAARQARCSAASF
jgi:hypothetical protein